MSVPADREIADIIAAVTSVAARKAPAKDKAMLERFIAQFYTGSPPDDLKARPAEKLYDTALAAWELLQQRKPGAAKIRVIAPPKKKTGKAAEAPPGGERTVILIVNDDMPFLVDSVTAELERMEAAPLLAIHPVLTLERDLTGQFIGLRDPIDDEDFAAAGEGAVTESLMHLEIPLETDSDMLERMRDNLNAVLGDVRLAVRDWQAMRRLTARISADFDGPSPGVTREQAEEVTDFLRWLHDDHYTFLGYRRFRIAGAGARRTLHIEHDQALGVLTKRGLAVFEGMQDGSAVPAQFAQFLDGKNLLLNIKANQRSTVHRRVHYDVVALKIMDEKGVIAGVHMFVGLFTADVYTNSPSFVPVLKSKIDRIRSRVGFRKHSHDGKRLQNIMENLPRDELFESSDDYLLQVGLGILHLQERARTAVFIRTDQFERFVSALVYVPRDRYDTALRLVITDILVKAFDGRLSSFYTQVSDSPLARIHIIIATKPGSVPKVSGKEIETRIAKAARAWSDDLRDGLVKALGEEEGAGVFDAYEHAFPSAYRERYDAAAGVADVARANACLATGQAGFDVYQSTVAGEDGAPTAGPIRIKIYNCGTSLPLSDIMPVLENFGFKVVGEEPFRISPRGSGGGRGPVWLHDFEVALPPGRTIDLAVVQADMEEAFGRVWAGEMESDGFNKLVAVGGLKWREVVILRAYAKYLRQAAFPFSQNYIEDAFAAHPNVARLLVDFFLTSFDPALNAGAKAKSAAAAAVAIRQQIVQALDAVTNADEDRILRRYLNLVDNTLRTNFFQKSADGAPKSYLSLKLNSKGIDELPLPRPMVEVFVYAPRVEAIHLRGGKVARGGIRWSDRREDFRSEILGLVKAQMVKNAVIVPTGSKGGFVVKRPPATGGREALLAEGIECYKTLQRGLLDITDNVVDDKIVHPKDVVRKDAEDPYLVVAADKGTATFSDIANGVSAEYGFWLGDAYASGGSVGYDHKAMGITAKGAWEAVKRHFREINVDTQTQDFICAGVGDMSGDVFGNGMLLSKHIKLVAAFNHMHIFIDPSPDPAKSFAERERLFKLPRSAWSDYDAKLISKGGGVFDRKAKTIKLTAEMKALLDLDKAEAAPNEIINAILKARVDLLFFGGIGTYVKSALESNADAADRANDAVRVNGAQIRAKVVGEGANLGMTQRGRIEAAKAGVRLNTDAIDNSAGVDCSDHEVNIKILLNGQMQQGKLALPARNKLLAEMTEEVGQLVLRDNYQQTQTISVMQRRGPQLLEAQQRMMKFLEREGLLNRDIEFLPSDEEIAERMTANQGLTRPEIAVFLPYGKMWLYEKLVSSDLPDDPLVEEDLIEYFPVPLRKKYAEAIGKHKLRREIIATVITNSFINRVTPSFLTTLMDRTGLGPVDVARAYTVTRAAYNLRDLWRAVEALDAKVPAETQMEMLLEINRMVERSVLWMLRHYPAPMDMAAIIAKLKPNVKALREALESVWTEDVAGYVEKQAGAYQAKGVPAKLAREVASIYRMAAANDITAVAEATKQTVPHVAKFYFLVGERFGLGRLRARTEEFGHGTHWDKLAVSAAIEELFAHQATMTQKITLLAKAKKLTGPKALEAWIAGAKASVDRYDQVFAEIKGSDALSLAMLTVANRQLSAMSSGQD